MEFAISLRSDHPSAEPIRALRRVVERFEDAPSMAMLGYPPHVTLAIHDGDAAGEEQVKDALDRASRNLDAVTLTFDAIRTFDGPPMVLWASPRPCPALSHAHAAIHAVIEPVHCRLHYRPGSWVPHCTLGMRIGDGQAKAARSFAAAFHGAIDVTFDRLDCVALPSLARIASRRLPWDGAVIESPSPEPHPGS